MKRLLVPTDFSENARHALHTAAAIAAHTGACLEIVHTNTVMAYAAPQPEYYVVGAEDMTDYYENAAASLHDLKAELDERPEWTNLAVETRIEEGFLNIALQRLAEEDKADLIVMGTQGSTGLTGFLLGSNTERVIRTAPCPVLAVPAKAGPFQLKTVVFATTLQPDQEKAFRTLAAWQRHFPFAVKALYLNNPAEFERRSDIEATAQRFAREAGLIALTTHSIGSTFNEAHSILQFAGAAQADLLVLATHQRRGLSHLLFGSLTEDTANHAAMPVLCIPI